VGRGADLDGCVKSSITGDRTRTVQSIASCYTDVVKQYPSNNLRNMTVFVKVHCFSVNSIFFPTNLNTNPVHIDLRNCYLCLQNLIFTRMQFIRLHF
jgi:hypothetical protein